MNRFSHLIWVLPFHLAEISFYWVGWITSDVSWEYLNPRFHLLQQHWRSRIDPGIILVRTYSFLQLGKTLSNATVYLMKNIHILAVLLQPSNGLSCLICINLQQFSQFSYNLKLFNMQILQQNFLMKVYPSLKDEIIPSFKAIFLFLLGFWKF